MSTSMSSAFRKIAKARKSCYRFQPNLEIPQNTLKDILDVTLVSESESEKFTKKNEAKNKKIVETLKPFLWCYHI